MNFGEGASLSAALGLVALALIPIALVTLTSFAKMAVVLSILKNALGAEDIPSGAIVTALALCLTVFVMAPVFDETQTRLGATSIRSLDVGTAITAIKEPLSGFLARNAGEKERKLLTDIAQERSKTARSDDLSVLWPSFALSELKRAFEIGFYLFLPFLVLDLVVANVLLAIGLTGLTPSAVALPFKLLLFVSVDGLLLLGRALVLGYK
jgi:type III secretion protein R